MKNRILFLLALVLIFSSYSKVSASELCSPKGYTVIAMNGIFTTEDGAVENKDNLKDRLLKPYNNEPIIVDYIYNPTHLSGVGDIFDAIAQGVFDQKSDYDLVEMLNDASHKVTTQKLLLVAHSQGNFYANNFYDKTASQEGGVPRESIGIYGVGSPANHVSGGGKYLTSDTDNVIASVVSKYIKILSPNIHIPISAVDGNGHSFSGVYLKYQGDRIVADIKSSLNKLKINDEQDSREPCISPQKLSTLHKIQGIILVSADFAIDKTKNSAFYVANGAYKAGVTVASAVSSIIKSINKKGDLALNNGASVVDGVEESMNALKDANSSSVKENSETTPKETSSGKVATETSFSAPVAPNDLPVSDSAISQKSRRGGGGGGADSNDLEVPALPEEEVVIPVPEVVPEPILEPVPEPTPDPIPETNPIPDIIPTPEPIPDTIPPVITINGNKIIAVVRNSNYEDAGATAVDDTDGSLEVIVTGEVNTAVRELYTITYTATDVAGNVATDTREVRVSSRVYVSKYTFGTENGDGNNWQVWAFNGSNIYDWTDTYNVDHYLNQKFKVQRFGGGVYYCSQCVVRGIFSRNPLEGFEVSDIARIDSIDNSITPQTGADGIYDVNIQWDATGYTTTVVLNSTTIIDDAVHTDISNVNGDMWVGWGDNANQFSNFPTGNWVGHSGWFPGGFENGLTGGYYMILQPFPVYDSTQTSTEPEPIPEPEPEPTPDPLPDPTPVPTPDPIPDPIPTCVDPQILVNNVCTNPAPAPDPIPEPTPEPIPTPTPDTTAPVVTGYKFNGTAGDITTNPLSSPLTLSFTANKDVDWVSIKIENQDDSTIYKIFQSGAGCVDFTDTCNKTWNGILSSGGLLQNGTFKIKIHIKDSSNNEYYDYLSPYKITIGI